MVIPEPDSSTLGPGDALEYNCGKEVKGAVQTLSVTVAIVVYPSCICMTMFAGSEFVPYLPVDAEEINWR